MSQVRKDQGMVTKDSETLGVRKTVQLSAGTSGSSLGTTVEPVENKAALGQLD